jgi:paraquat-inducible protein B
VTTEVRPRIVGIFTLIGLALIVVGLAAIGPGRLFSQHRTFVVFFPNPVSGLKDGAPVTFRQTPMGQVRDVELVFTGRGMETEVKVIADVRKGALRDLAGKAAIADLSDAEFVETLVKAGLRAAVHSSSPIAGQKSLDLDFHPEREARFSGIPMPYPEVPTGPSSLRLVQDKLEEALDKAADIPVTDVVLQLRTTLESAQTFLDSGNLTGALGDLRRGLQTADRALTRAARTLDGMDAMMGNVQTTLAGVDKTLDGLKTTFGHLDGTLATMDRTLGTVDRTVDRTADTQHEAAKTLDEMRELIRSMRHLVDTLQRNPEAVILGRPAPEKKK